MREVHATPDFYRIKALPRRTPEEYADELTEVLRQPNGTQRLRPIQAQALMEAAQCNGAFCPIVVGGGKTLITLLLAQVMDAKCPLLVVPANLLEKTRRAIRDNSNDWRIPTRLQVTSYEKMGRVSFSQQLDFWKPDLIVFDECHRVKNKRAAVTRRFARHMRAYPHTRVAAVSGTIMRSSIKDFSHLIAWCLKDSSPLPLEENSVMMWSDALDEKVGFLNRMEPGCLLQLPGAEDELDPLIAARKKVRSRLIETAGVIATDTEDVGSSLYIRGVQHDVNPTTENNFRILRDLWETPSGWTLSMAGEVWAKARQLALGLHYTWFREVQFKSCVNEKMLASSENGISDIERRILKSCENMTGKGIEQIPGLIHQLSGNAAIENTGISTDTGLPSQIMKNFSPNLMVNVISAGFVGPDGRIRSSNICASTTAIKQAGLEGFFAMCAIGRSDCWEILLKSFPGLLATFKEAFRAAGPPDEWLNRRRDWARFVRTTLSGSRHLDSELQVVNACDAGELDPTYLAAWREIRPTYTIEPKPVWHDESALEFCAKWGKEEPGLIWCEHVFFARELAQRTGWTYFGENGLADDGRYIEEEPNGQSIILSQKANSAGRNLQYLWNRNLFTTVFPGALDNEQTIGRTHRTGQAKDEVIVDMLMTCAEHFETWTKNIGEAMMAEELLGQKQKILMADSDLPLPGRGVRWQKP